MVPVKTPNVIHKCVEDESVTVCPDLLYHLLVKVSKSRLTMQSPNVIPVQRFFPVPKFPPPTFQKSPQVNFQVPRQHTQPTQAIEFDGKRLRKAVTRKTVDYNSSVIKYLENRVWQRDYRDRRAMQPDPAYYTEMMPPLSMPDNPINSVTTKFVRTSTNKMRCPIFCVAWTPEGRRLVTGASSGEFTLWNGLTFNFETILQAHDSPVRCMVWSHNDLWMVTGDHAGYVKYWQSNMNNVKMFQAHKEPLRGISFCPVDTKFVTCSDDGTVRIWDFLKCFEEKILRGHGADVKCVDWHPQKSLLVSGSKDSQQPIKLWDPKSGQSLATIHAHKNTVMDAKWNKNGNWLITASRDHLIKLFDIRNMKEEVQTFRGHKKEATTLAWHPIHESLYASGGSDGCVMFWCVGADKEVGCMEQAHDSCVWSLAWHPLGHILCSGSNDHSSKFWTRNRPGDRMRDKYNLNTLPKGQEDAVDYDDSTAVSSIPGMGLEYGLPDHLKNQERFESEILSIPGLDFTTDENTPDKSVSSKKTPYSKPIPKQFQQQWMESKQPLLLAPPMEPLNGEIQPSNASEVAPPPLPPPSLMPLAEQHQNQNFPPNAMLNNQFQDQQQPRPMEPHPAPHMQDMHYGNMQSGDNPYRRNEEVYPMDHPHRAENVPRETWRTYDVPADRDDRSKHNEMRSENGAFLHDQEPRPGFEHHNNVRPPPSRGRPERFPRDHRMEDEFIGEKRHSRGGPPLFGDVDSRNNHMGHGPPKEDMGFMPHKRSWNEGPGREESFGPGGRDEPYHDGPHNFQPRPHMRPPLFHSPRGSRGGPPYRGPRPPFGGRGRGGRYHH